MNGRTQAFVLVLFGGALLRLATSDALLRYVRPVARPWVLLAGIGILALGLWALIAPIVRGRATHEPHPDADQGVDAHGHRAASSATWLVIAPVVAILVIAPPALGTFSASRVPVTVTKPADVHFPALPAGDPVKVGLLDFAVRAIWDSGRTLDGRTVSLTGFVLRHTPGGFLLSRLVIVCCAADARPIDIQVDTSSPPPSIGGWVTVVGRYGGLSPASATLPMVMASSVNPVGQPANPYDD